MIQNVFKVHIMLVKGHKCAIYYELKVYGWYYLLLFFNLIIFSIFELNQTLVRVCCLLILPYFRTIEIKEDTPTATTGHNQHRDLNPFYQQCNSNKALTFQNQGVETGTEVSKMFFFVALRANRLFQTDVYFSNPSCVEKMKNLYWNPLGRVLLERRHKLMKDPRWKIYIQELDILLLYFNMMCPGYKWDQL